MERHFEGKLYNPRSAEGEPNWAELKQIRELDEALSSHEGYVGLAPYGSTIGGYSNKDSDIDVKIFFDNDIYKKHDYKDRYNFEALSKITEAARKSFRNQGERDVHIYFHDITLNTFTKPEFTDPFEYGHRAADIFRMTTGDKIDAYREKVVDYVRQFSQDYQDTFKRAVAGKLLEFERASIKKHAARVSGTDEAQIIEDKRKLLEQRVEHFFKNPKEERDFSAATPK